jgi:sulfate adenylyltransferase subunit 1
MQATLSQDQLNNLKDTALKFITCGSVDDGKSTLIGRLLVDTQAVLEDHLAGVQRKGETDLALLTDGLSAEREQGITIDVAYRYFSTEHRKFIIGDAPGHEQYTRNMVTAASSADCAVVLVDATKLKWQKAELELLAQTRRHTLLAQLLRVPSIVFVVNKLDAVEDPTQAFMHIQQALKKYAQDAAIQYKAIVPISALKGWNVVEAKPQWCGYKGPSLLQLLEALPSTPPDVNAPTSVCVQWVEKQHDSARTDQGRRVFWGRVASGRLSVGQSVQVHPSGQTAKVAQVLNCTRQTEDKQLGWAGQSVGVILDREVDVSRGDWLLEDVGAKLSDSSGGTATSTEAAGFKAPAVVITKSLEATMCWLDDEPLVKGRMYWALHGHQWVKAQVAEIVHRLDILTLAPEEAQNLEANAIGVVKLNFKEPLAIQSYEHCRLMGAMILVDSASHKTSGAVLIKG